MILKEKAQQAPQDKWHVAGDAAERELAFYLRRYFGDDGEVFVLHDVRLEMDGDAAQMDHVIIHPAGLTIVESKSVAGRLQMKEDGQWLRWFDDRATGMASPLIQAKLQAEFLRKFLRRNAKQPGVIDRLSIDYLVSISSKGQFLAPRGVSVPEVCKVDLIGERIREKIAGELAFPAPFRRILGEYMARMHTPRAESSVRQTTVPAAASGSVAESQSVYQTGDAALTHLQYIGDRLPKFEAHGVPDSRKVYATFCKACRSAQLEFRYGKFGYYLKCLECGENTGCKLECRQCRRQVKLRKDEQLLFVECVSCGLSEVLHRNDKPELELMK